MSFFKDMMVVTLTRVMGLLILIRGMNLNHWLNLPYIDEITAYNHYISLAFVLLVVAMYQGNGLIGWFGRIFKPTG